jgi:hypothetical protein
MSGKIRFRSPCPFKVYHMSSGYRGEVWLPNINGDKAVTTPASLNMRVGCAPACPKALMD